VLFTVATILCQLPVTAVICAVSLLSYFAEIRGTLLVSSFAFSFRNCEYDFLNKVLVEIKTGKPYDLWNICCFLSNNFCLLLDVATANTSWQFMLCNFHIASRSSSFIYTMFQNQRSLLLQSSNTLNLVCSSWILMKYCTPH